MKRSPSPSQRSSRDRMALGADRARSVPECSILFHIEQPFNIINYKGYTPLLLLLLSLKHRSSRQAIGSKTAHNVSLCFVSSQNCFILFQRQWHIAALARPRRPGKPPATGRADCVVKRRNGTERLCRSATKHTNGETRRRCGEGAADSGRQGRREVEMYRVLEKEDAATG